MAGIIDTHSHLQSPSFAADRDALADEARRAGVEDVLICAGEPEGFGFTAETARSLGWHYALGIHPMHTRRGMDVGAGLEAVRSAVQDALADPLFAAVGEIGLDGWLKDLDRETQLACFRGQLKIAKEFGLPVSVHARHAVDAVIAAIRRTRPAGGVIHAFNGSFDQAGRLIGLGMKLGFGGAMCYDGSKRIRKLFAGLPAESIVLETDAPDMPSQWRSDLADRRTHPADIARYAETGAVLRGSTVDGLISACRRNALKAFPRMRKA